MLQNLNARSKFALALGYDTIVTLLAFQASLYLRLGETGFIPLKNNLIYLGIASLTQILVFLYIGFYKGIWRYSSTYDLIRIIKGATFGTLASLMILFMYNRLFDVPRTVFIIDWLLLIVFLGGGRLGYRIFRDSVSLKNQSSTAKKVLIIGAGAGGEQIYREIRKNPSLDLRVIGFIDDDSNLRKKHIHGCPVLGTSNEIEVITQQYEVDVIYIAIPSGTGDQIKKIYDHTKKTGLPVKVLPKMDDILKGNVKLSQFRNIEVEDILGRKEINLDSVSIKSMLEGKAILITGAGGSIGSEIVRQVALFNPSRLYLVDNSEFNLYQLERDLQSKFPELPHSIHMIDIKDETALKSIFSNKLDVVFHAAAYKHVPLVEANPYAAIETNVKGTELVAKLSIEFNVTKFVLISSDKAVNPTNIMGATKRIAELICLKKQTESESTKFVTVRFGNVLGSSGSVIPLFRQQIQQGGPVTVTHPEIKRYFMSIPEASQLVLQAGAIGKGGEIFVLDMGEPIFIVDIAKQMISLSGHTEEEIEITYTGLRPGEKMFEELLLDDESTLQTIHPMVKMARASQLPENFDPKIESLINLGPTGRVSDFKIKIKEIVTHYKPENLEKDPESSSPIEKNLH